METWGIFAIILAFVGGILVGWTARSEERSHEQNNGTESGSVFRADLKYIKRGIEELRKEQKAVRQDMESQIRNQVNKADDSTQPKQNGKTIDDESICSMQEDSNLIV